MFLFRVFCLVIFLAVLSNHAFAQTVDPSKTIVSGFQNTTITGIARYITILPKDSNGNPVTDCSVKGDFSITMTGPGGVTVPVIIWQCLESTGQETWDYTPKVATTYTVTVLYKNQPVAKSPYTVVFTPGALFVPNCFQRGLKKNVNITVGVLDQFKIFTADIYGNLISNCPSNSKNLWNISFSGPDGSNVLQNNYTCNAGVFTASFSLNFTGHYFLSVSSGKENINNSPFDINLKATFISADHSYVLGPGYYNGVAGVNSVFSIVLEDYFGNRVTTCPSQFNQWNITIIPYNASQQTFYGYITSCSNGVLAAGYITTIAGQYNIATYYQQNQLRLSEQELTISADPNMDVTNSRAIGGGYNVAIAGSPTVFQVAPYDKYGNRIQKCLPNINYKDFQVTVDPNQGCSSESTGCNQELATYSMTYSCQKAMTYNLAVSYNGDAISNSPTSTVVVPSVISGADTQFSGTGLHTAYAGVQAPIFIETYDQYGNKVKNCSAQSNTKFVVQATLVGAGITVNGIVGNCIAGTGNFNAYYVIKQISNSPYSLSISYGGETLDTFPVTTYPGPPFLSKCNVTGTRTVTAGDQAVINIFCYDQFNNPITQCFNDDYWSVHMKGPTQYNATQESCNNGNNVFTYIPQISGQYTSNITFVGMSSSYTGLSVLVNPAEFDPSNSAAQGNGVNPNAFLTIDSNATFQIVSRDRFGNRVTNCVDLSTITITITGPNSNIVYPSLSKCNNGIIPVSYRPHISGEYTLIIEYNGNPISGNPYHANWNAGAVDVSKCQVTGPGTTDNTAGQWADVYFSCSDQYNNPITYCEAGFGNWTITQLQSSPNFQSKIASCTGGSYTGLWYAERAGLYNISVNYIKKQISGRSYGATLHPAGISSPNSKAAGTGLSSTTQAGTSLTITIITYDKFNNKISMCYPSNPLLDPHQIVSTSILESSSYWNLTLTTKNHWYAQKSDSDCSNGQYTITYSVTQVGIYQVLLTGNDLKHPQGSPGTITITPGPLVPDTITANFPEANAIAGATYKLFIYGTDQYGNPVQTCGYTGSFAISAMNYTGKIDGCTSGNYTASIVIMEYDTTVAIHVHYNSSEVRNSPGNVMFGYGNFVANNSYAFGDGVNASVRLVAGKNSEFQVVLVNQFNVPIHSAGLCNQMADQYNWTVSLLGLSSLNYTYYNFLAGQVQCNDQNNIHLWYNKTVTDDYVVVILIRSGNHSQSLPIAYRVTIYPDELVVSTAMISNVTQDVETSGVFNLVGFDRWGNLADFTGQLSEWQIYLSPQCIFNYPIHCTAEKSNTSHTVTHASCHYNVSYGGVYCLIVTYQGLPLPHIPVTKLLVAGGYQCSPACQNGGFCIPTTVVNNNFNQSTNHSSNHTTNGTGLAAGQCHCQTSYTGEQCQTKISKSYMGLGLAIGLIIGLAILLFIIGLIIGFFVSRRQHHHHHEGLIE